MYEDEMADGVVALVVLTGYKVESYKTFIGIWKLKVYIGINYLY